MDGSEPEDLLGTLSDEERQLLAAAMRAPDRPRAVDDAGEGLLQLHDENQRLKAQLRETVARIRELEAEIARLRRQAE